MRTLPAADLTEKQLAALVVDMLRLTDWGFYHTFRSTHSPAGYPDYSCWRDRHIWLELKARRGKLSPAQRTVIGGLLKAGDEVYVIREADLDDLLHVLRRRRGGADLGGYTAAERLSAATRREVEL